MPFSRRLSAISIATPLGVAKKTTSQPIKLSMVGDLKVPFSGFTKSKISLNIDYLPIEKSIEEAYQQHIDNKTY